MLALVVLTVVALTYAPDGSTILNVERQANVLRTLQEIVFDAILRYNLERGTLRLPYVSWSYVQPFKTVDQDYDVSENRR